MRSWRVGPDLANEQQKKFGEEADRSTLKIYARRFHGVRNWQWILNSIHWCTIPDTASTAPSSQSHSSGVTLLKEKQMPGACGRDWERQWPRCLVGVTQKKMKYSWLLKNFNYSLKNTHSKNRSVCHSTHKILSPVTNLIPFTRLQALC